MKTRSILEGALPLAEICPNIDISLEEKVHMLMLRHLESIEAVICEYDSSW